MGMMGYRRPPCVEHGRDPDPSAQVFGIGGDRHHCLGRRLEQQVIHGRFVLPGDLGDFGWQSEDDVEIADRPRDRARTPRR